jgi:uncharacterized membrane-anchored protein
MPLGEASPDYLSWILQVGAAVIGLVTASVALGLGVALSRPNAYRL